MILGSKGSWGTLWGEEENTGSLVLENDLNRQEGEEGKAVLPEQQMAADEGRNTGLPGHHSPQEAVMTPARGGGRRRAREGWGNGGRSEKSQVGQIIKGIPPRTSEFILKILKSHKYF